MYLKQSLKLWNNLDMFFCLRKVNLLLCYVCSKSVKEVVKSVIDSLFSKICAKLKRTFGCCFRFSFWKIF